MHGWLSDFKSLCPYELRCLPSNPCLTHPLTHSLSLTHFLSHSCCLSLAPSVSVSVSVSLSQSDLNLFEPIRATVTLDPFACLRGAAGTAVAADSAGGGTAGGGAVLSESPEDLVALARELGLLGDGTLDVLQVTMRLDDFTKAQFIAETMSTAYK